MTGNQFRHPAIDEWIAGVDAALAEQRDHSISPSEGGRFPAIGEVQSWTTSFGDFTHSVERLLDRLTNDPGRWVLVIEIDEAHDRFFRFVLYEDGSLVLETLGNRYLRGEFRLSEEQAAHLTAMGWQPPFYERATWAYIEATHSPDIEQVASNVVGTLRRVFRCEDRHPLTLRLSSLAQRGATAASERPLAPIELDTTDQGHWPQRLRAVQHGSLSLPRRQTGPSAPYYETLYPEPTGPISGFGQWKRATTGNNIATAYWDARERARERWESTPHITAEWALTHPPVVLWMPVAAEAACLGCTWLGGGVTIEGAAERARQHAVDGGDDPAVVWDLSVPISARSGQDDGPLGRSSVPPQFDAPPIDRLLTGPAWDHFDTPGLGCVSSAIVDLGPPAANLDGPATLLFLEVQIDEDGGGGFIWSCGISEEESGFGEAEWGSGNAASVEQAEIDCWAAVVAALGDDGYTVEEIIEAVR